jgi:hypothetical protein
MFLAAKSPKADAGKKGGKAGGKAAASAAEPKKSWSDGISLPYLLGAPRRSARCRQRRRRGDADTRTAARGSQHGQRRGRRRGG